MGFPERDRLRISGTALIFGAMLLLVLPLRWFLAAILAAIFHELCHYAAARLLGGRVGSVFVGGSGAVMQIAPLGQGRELVCALAGPVGGFLLLLFARWFPRLALCAAFQSLYNLLPVYPMDGGRAIRCLAAMTLPPDAAEKLCGIVAGVCRVLIVLLALWAVFVWHLGCMPLLLAALILIRTAPGKSPCKL